MTRQLVVYAAIGEGISPTLLRVTAGRSTTRERREIKRKDKVTHFALRRLRFFMTNHYKKNGN